MASPPPLTISSANAAALAQAKDDALAFVARLADSAYTDVPPSLVNEASAIIAPIRIDLDLIAARDFVRQALGSSVPAAWLRYLDQGSYDGQHGDNTDVQRYLRAIKLGRELAAVSL